MTTTLPSDVRSDEIGALIAATPGDVLWEALFGFGPADPMFRNRDGHDPARLIAGLIASVGSEGLPIIGDLGERCWKLPDRFRDADLATASAVLMQALDLAAADETAERSYDDDERDVFAMAAHANYVRVDEDALESCLRTLVDLPSWWLVPKANITLVNRPRDDRWRLAVAGMDSELLVWRAGKAVEETKQNPDTNPMRLLDGPIGTCFRQALGPPPLGYVRRIEAATENPYFARSAQSWLAAAAQAAFARLPVQKANQGRPTWRWAGTRRQALTAAMARLSGSALGAIAERIVIAGPFEPEGNNTAMNFIRVSHGGIQDAVHAFMSSAMNGGEL
ncbi:hypothetical protein ACVIGB_000092 [Bradyrhizobium sp. USDA 4341]